VRRTVDEGAVDDEVYVVEAMLEHRDPYGNREAKENPRKRQRAEDARQ
jgi:hypothetical protein